MSSLLLVVVIVLLIILLSRTKPSTYNNDTKRSIDQLNEKIAELIKHVSALQKEKEAYQREIPVADKNETFVPPIIIDQPTIQPVEIPAEPSGKEAHPETANEQVSDN